MAVPITSFEPIPDPAAALTPAEFEQAMIDLLGNGDKECRHMEADDLLVTVLRSLGYGAGCDVFDSMSKWYA